eukprot:TRINITY_DN44713_c0_g1_i1.p1 TRINITY_DN44713_c0_g1~~TRINITY_DN44713_c0_g1_i1.p1  ORF type:complete len:233 (-),score=7.41 TRINITY_DN44713_c0_g1_i1:16-693(-)
MKETVIQSDCLSAIYILGAGMSMVDVFQNYIDTSFDVQSVACFYLASGAPQTDKTKRWVEMYRHLLNRFCLGVLRNEFDHKWPAGKGPTIPKVEISCRHCGHPYGQPGKQQVQKHVGHRRGLPRNVKSAPPQTVNPRYCNNCRKPLPACVVCLYPMEIPGDSAPPLPPDLLFTWCQKCGHCGHAGHYRKWFSESGSDECPAPGCTCKCLKHDPPPLKPPTSGDSW